jgi:alpha-tubulin suppressor-like RCC1 family protein
MIAAGGFHTVVVTEDNEIVSFGDNTKNQIGSGTTGGKALSPTYTDMSGVLFGRKISKLSAGACSTIVATEDGKLVTFGCLLGSDKNSSVPVLIEAPSFSEINLPARFNNHLIMVLDGVLYGFGSNRFVQLPVVNSLVLYMPENIIQGKPMLKISSYTTATVIATRKSSKLYAWYVQLEYVLKNTNTLSGATWVASLEGLTIWFLIQ